MNLTTKSHEQLLSGMFDNDGPFERDGDVVYMKHDALKIVSTASSDWRFGVKVGFVWRGIVTAWVFVPGIGLEGGAVLSLTGIEGRQRVHVL